jgi:hypothetical protein
MNAKLQQLMDRSFTDEQGEVFDPERFAELIVLKCAEIADTAEPFLTSDLIKEHFGIEQ